jgi:hypothetical protein
MTGRVRTCSSKEQPWLLGFTESFLRKKEDDDDDEDDSAER